MAERIQQLILAEKELLANVSHELRTPLARIRVALDIAGEADAETGRMSMTEIGVDIAELESIIDDIVTSTRLEIARGGAPMAGFALHMEEIGPEAICDRAQERFRARHVVRPLRVEVEEKLPVVRADPVLLRRVVDNLLENAHKYSPDPATEVSLRLRRAPGGVVFEIGDGGIGIAPEDVPHVFAPFFRAERSRARGGGGVGLGLTLAKRIVDAHGGSIEVESAVGAGTTMRVFLPEDT
jgi:two-component system OmpR family sensor kinase